MPSIHRDEWIEETHRHNREKIGRRRDPERGRGEPRPRRRAHERDEFKCGKCRTFVGPTLFGGRHRNHCPRCLASRHVDRSRPGDRLSDCGGMMPAIGTFFRPDGEQMLLHRCNGCGAERHNRIAADDDPTMLLRLPVVAPRRGGSAAGAADLESAA